MATELATGTVIGRFALIQRLGTGATGEVWEASDTVLGRAVALKLLFDATAERVLREARAMARVSHENIAVVYDAIDTGSHATVSMELLRGGTLRDWLATPRSRRAIVDVLLAAARGLGAAHRAGIVHRDFKPDNVLLGERGEVKVADFGLADATPVVAAPGDALVTASKLAGTPAYMAPEQLLGHPSDARADQFAFCVTAWEALTGGRPFEIAGVEGVASVALRIAAITDRRFVRAARPLPRRLEAVLRRGLSPEPADRFPSIDALIAALARRSRGAWWIVPAAAAIVIAIAVWPRAPHARPLLGGRLLQALPHIGDLPPRYSRDATRLVLGAAAVGHVRLLDGAGRQVADLAAPAGLVLEAAAPVADDAVLVGGARGASWEVWRLAAAGQTRIGSIDRAAMAKPQPAQRPSLEPDGDGALVLSGALFALAGDRPPRVLATMPPGHGTGDLRLSPARDWVANWDIAGGDTRIVIRDRSGAVLSRVQVDDPCRMIRGFDWSDDRHLVVAGYGPEVTPLCDVELDDRGQLVATTRHAELGSHATSALRVAGGELVVEGYDSMMQVVAGRRGEALRPLFLPGDSPTALVGFTGDHRLTVGVRAAGHATTVDLDVDTNASTPRPGPAGTPVMITGTHVVVRDENCSLVDDRGHTLALDCAADPTVLCAGFAAAPCLLARTHDELRSYDWFDPDTLAIAARAYEVPMPDNTDALGDALSWDGKQLALPRPDGIAIVELGSRHTRQLPVLVQFVAWEADGQHLIAAQPGEKNRLMRLDLDGRVETLAEGTSVFGEPRIARDGRFVALELTLSERYYVFALDP